MADPLLLVALGALAALAVAAAVAACWYHRQKGRWL